MDTMTDLAMRVAGLLDGAQGFGASVLFDCEQDGVLLIDGRDDAISISTRRGAADCVIEIPFATLLRIMAGELDETTAFMNGEMKLTGRVGLATQVSGLMRQAQQRMQQSAQQQ